MTVPLRERAARGFGLDGGRLSRPEEILRALEDVRESFGEEDLTIAVPYPVTDGVMAKVLSHDPKVSVIAHGPDETTAAQFPERVGHFVPDLGTWNLPGHCAHRILFLGEHGQVGVRMAREALRRGVTSLVFPKGRRDWLDRDLRWHLAAAAVVSAQRRLPTVALSRQRGAWSRFTLPNIAFLAPLLRRLTERRYNEAFEKGRAQLAHGILPKGAFAANRVLLVSASLGGGGAERQVANTAAGLAVRAAGHHVSVLCERLDAEGHDFFLPDLQAAGVAVHRVQDLVPEAREDDLRLVRQRLDPILQTVPYWIAEGILGYAAAFLTLRPEVVHAWQDETNIKAGFAAAVVGVPVLVLSTRSVAPTHFALYQPYMRGGYRLLADHPRVQMLNNSRAGATDYACWLGIERSRISVLHNGLLVDEFRRPPKEEVRRWAEDAGIRPAGPVVGTVLRFCEEKGPLLWVRVAALVAQARPDARFLMVGDGPLLGEARALAERLGISERLLTPGRVKRPALPLALMDVFLLVSRMEGLPNVLLEAQALGVPVVTTDAGGAGETIESGITGWAVRPQAPERLAERVIAVLDDSPWRANARERAPAFVRETFALERMLDETLATYASSRRRIDKA